MVRDNGSSNRSKAFNELNRIKEFYFWGVKNQINLRNSVGPCPAWDSTTEAKASLIQRLLLLQVEASSDDCFTFIRHTFLFQSVLFTCDVIAQVRRLRCISSFEIRREGCNTVIPFWREYWASLNFNFVSREIVGLTGKVDRIAGSCSGIVFRIWLLGAWWRICSWRWRLGEATVWF